MIAFPRALEGPGSGTGARIGKGAGPSRGAWPARCDDLLVPRLTTRRPGDPGESSQFVFRRSVPSCQSCGGWFSDQALTHTWTLRSPRGGGPPGHEGSPPLQPERLCFDLSYKLASYKVPFLKRVPFKNMNHFKETQSFVVRVVCEKQTSPQKQELSRHPRAQTAVLSYTSRRRECSRRFYKQKVSPCAPGSHVT